MTETGRVAAVLELNKMYFIVREGSDIDATSDTGLPLTIHVERLSATEVVLNFVQLNRTVQLR